MKSQGLAVSIKEMSDEVILEEAAARLQVQYTRENGSRLLYGTFRFLFHEGRFQGVEDWPRNKRYVSPEREADEKNNSR